MPYTLLKDGDSFEQKYWNLFLQEKFPTYERYWIKKITPLTKRPVNIHFRSAADLIANCFNAEDVCKAQLHYTILRQMIGRMKF